jgi:hypothetical protein
MVEKPVEDEFILKMHWNMIIGLYYKIIMRIISDDRKGTLYNKFFTTIVSALPLATVINSDH